MLLLLNIPLGVLENAKEIIKRIVSDEINLISFCPIVNINKHARDNQGEGKINFLNFY